MILRTLLSTAAKSASPKRWLTLLGACAAIAAVGGVALAAAIGGPPASPQSSKGGKTPPPTPTITQEPSNPTTSTSATFAFTDAQAGVSFQCKLDSAAWTACTSPKTYTGLKLGMHGFNVRALDSAGNKSEAASYSWTIVAQQSGQPFTISGTTLDALYPGVTRALPLTIANPNGVAISVTSLIVTVQAGSSNAGCDGPTNLTVTQSDVSSTNALTVPANGQVTLPSGTVHAPQIAMKDLATNQDACKGATYSLSYSGSAHS
jgi:hypothetical protein